MSNELQIINKQSVTERMADKYGTEKGRFYKIVKATCRMEKGTDEQFENFLLTAEHYNLNPLMKQMWAYPDRNGGIMTMVAVDGWIKIVNERPEFDGYTTEVEFDDKGNPFSATCTMWRKDRSRPTVKTIYFKEWVKESSPVWKQMPIHFIEIRAYIQCARMCFNIGGIYDGEVAPLELNYPEAIEIKDTAINNLNEKIKEKKSQQLAEPEKPKEPELKAATKVTDEIEEAAEGEIDPAVLAAANNLL